MPLTLRAGALAFTLALAACGGGGSSGTTSAGTPPVQAVAITETNAKPVAASGIDAVENTSSTRGATGLPIGVQIDAGGSAAPSNLQLIADIARLAATSMVSSHLPVAVAVSETDACPLGGTMTISGNVASASGLFAGDSLSVSTNNCAVSESGTTVVLSGQMSMTVAAGSITALPFHVVLAVSASNLSVTTGNLTAVSSGDVRLDWTANSATSQTLVASGSSMSSRETVNGVAHTTTLRNYSQSLTLNGSISSGTLSATVETDASAIGSGVVSYTISTPTAVVWNASTRMATAGVIHVVGANNSQLLITINADGSVTIQVDANGDGIYEKTITSTIAELAGLI